MYSASATKTWTEGICTAYTKASVAGTATPRVVLGAKSALSQYDICPPTTARHPANRPPTAEPTS